MIELFIIGVLIDHGPLVILVICLLLLWSFGQLMTHARIHLAYEYHTKMATEPRYSTASAQPISGLSFSELDKFKNLVDKKDKLQLAMFFAVHQPSVQEMGELLEVLNNDLTPESLQMVGKIDNTAQDSSILDSEKFSVLNDTEMQNISYYSQTDKKVLDDDFISKFGNMLFMENFIMYDHLCHTNPAVFHVPPGDDLRRMFDTFVKTGMAIQGHDIPLAERLHILKLPELQEIANSIGVNQEFTSIEEAANVLSRKSQSKIRLAAKYPISELFLLIREVWDVNAVEQEWSVYNSYAKLICTNEEQVSVEVEKRNTSTSI